MDTLPGLGWESAKCGMLTGSWVAPFFTVLSEGEQKTEAGATFLDLPKVLDV